MKQKQPDDVVWWEEWQSETKALEPNLSSPKMKKNVFLSRVSAGRV
jgi:hypothetical protein